MKKLALIILLIGCFVVRGADDPAVKAEIQRLLNASSTPVSTPSVQNTAVEPTLQYRIGRLGLAAIVTIEQGDAPKYVFRKGDKIVREIFVHALEIEPKPEFPQTPESKAANSLYRLCSYGPSLPRYLFSETEVQAAFL